MTGGEWRYGQVRSLGSSAENGLFLVLVTCPETLHVYMRFIASASWTGSPRCTGQGEVLPPTLPPLHPSNIFGLQEYHPRKLPQIPAALSALRMCDLKRIAKIALCALVHHTPPLGIGSPGFSSGSLWSRPLVHVLSPELFARLLKPGPCSPFKLAPKLILAVQITPCYHSDPTRNPIISPK